MGVGVFGRIAGNSEYLLGQIICIQYTYIKYISTYGKP